jgi:hypothetical protein
VLPAAVPLARLNVDVAAMAPGGTKWERNLPVSAEAVHALPPQLTLSQPPLDRPFDHMAEGGH